MSILDQVKKKMSAAIEHFKNELKNIRTGRASPGLVEHVSVELYGSSLRLKDIASITAPDSRQLLITPFDAKNASLIGKAIEKANIGFMPIVDGNSVRLKIPPMTEELRMKMARICRDEQEKAKTAIRTIRRDANDTIRKQKTDKEITEDIMKKLEKNIQELTDQSCKEIDSLIEKKEKELATV